MGNFEATFWYFWDIYCNRPQYNLLNNNCLHIAAKALNKGVCIGKYSSYHQKALKYLLKETVPNIARDAFAYFKKHYKKYYNTARNKRKRMSNPYHLFTGYSI